MFENNVPWARASIASCLSEDAQFIPMQSRNDRKCEIPEINKRIK